MSSIKGSLSFIKSESVNADNKSNNERELFIKNKDYHKLTIEDLSNNRYRLNTKIRIFMVIWSVVFVTAWCIMVGIVLLNNNDVFCLDNSIIITLLSTTTIEVLGIIAIVMYDIFNGKSEDLVSKN